jgi:hypothetical protein
MKSSHKQDMNINPFYKYDIPMTFACTNSSFKRTQECSSGYPHKSFTQLSIAQDMQRLQYFRQVNAAPQQQEAEP